MSTAQVLAGVGALLVVGGALLAVAAWFGWVPAASHHGGRRLPGLGRGAAAVALGLVGWALTGWPVLGVAAGAAAVGLPAVFGSDRREQRRIARVEAVEEWARRVADVISIGIGLEQALQSAARSAPAPIEPEVSNIAARISARMPTEVALRRFADEVDDPAADLLVAALILASRRRGPGVATALSAIAGSVGEEVAARRRVEADRAKPRATARAVAAITVFMIAVGLLNSGYTSPYGTPLGQAVLAATLAFFAASLWWMHSMTVSTPPERLLSGFPWVHEN